MDEPATRRARHQPGDDGVCEVCWDSWPCAVAVEYAQRVTADAEVEQYRDALEAVAQERDAERQARQAAEQEVARLRPVVDAALGISTYSPETLNAGIQRLINAVAEYEDSL